MYELAGMVRYYEEYPIDLRLWYLKLNQEDIEKSVKKTVQRMQECSDEVIKKIILDKQFEFC